MPKTRISKRDRWRWMREHYKRCWYCEIEMIYFPLRNGQRTPDNYATIEHLNSKLQFPNGRPRTTGRQRSIVVCCFKCNIARSDREVSQLTKEDVWRRSGRKPIALRG